METGRTIREPGTPAHKAASQRIAAPRTAVPQVQGRGAVTRRRTVVISTDLANAMVNLVHERFGTALQDKADLAYWRTMQLLAEGVRNELIERSLRVAAPMTTVQGRVTVPDSKFNRRAARFAKTAAKQAEATARAAKHRATYVPRRKKDEMGA